MHMQWLATIRIPPTEERTIIFDGVSKNPTTCAFSGTSAIDVDCFVVKSVTGDCDVTVDKCTNFVDKKVKVVEAISARVVVVVAIDTDPNFFDGEVVVVEIISLSASTEFTRGIGTNFVDGKIIVVEIISVGVIGGFTDSVIDSVLIPKLNKNVKISVHLRFVCQFRLPNGSSGEDTRPL